MSNRKTKNTRKFNELAPANQPARYKRNEKGEVVEFNGFGKNAAKRKARGV